MAANDLTTVANVKAWLSLPQAADDALIARLITSVSTLMQSWLGCKIISASYAVIKDGTGGTSLFLRNTPVTAVASLSINGVAVPASTGPGVLGYRFAETQVIVDGYRFTRGNANIAITYTAGYAVVPPDLEQAAIEIVALRYRERDRIGHTSKTLAGETVAFFIGDMPASAKTTLQQYKLVLPT